MNKELKKGILLANINDPSDLRKLSPEQLPQLCGELRTFLIDTLSSHPGHFGSSLGVIELTVALHYVLDTPNDRLIWDVGHQAYGHKVLTGRADRFHTLRQMGGISGFPNPEESIYDAFIAGHASTSISAALGMAMASQIKEEPRREIVAVIGDGSLTGGLAFEGLNNVSGHPNNLLIVLNDNEIAIDENVGGLSQYLLRLTTSKRYNKLRNRLYHALRRSNIATDRNTGFITRFTNSIKALVGGQQNLFEGLNIRYFGPLDGHDIGTLVKVLKDLKEVDGPKILHIKTTKGKGYKPAEETPTEWHAPGKFNKHTGERQATKSAETPPLYQDVFGHTLVELADANPAIVAITPAMPTGCSMIYMMEKYPNRSFDVGIAEGHAVTFSAGLAKEGMLPFCNIYSSFMQRAYDQIIHDVALQKTRIVICLDRAGLVGEDGPTHHGVFDIAALRPIPNLTIAAPMNEHDLRNLMYTAVKKDLGALVIRYPRGKGILHEWRNPMQCVEVGKARMVRDGSEVAVLSIGNITNTVEEALTICNRDGVCAAHYNFLFISPLDTDLLDKIAERFSKIITVENGVKRGGFGSSVVEYLSERNYSGTIKRMGIDHRFIEHGTIQELHKRCGLDAASIATTITEVVNSSRG